MTLHLKDIEALKAEIKTIRYENKILCETLTIIQDQMDKAEETKPESPSPPAPTPTAPKNYASVAATPTPHPPPPKKVTSPTIHERPFNKTQRQLIVQLTEAPPAHVTDDLRLSTANEATKNTTTRFCLAQRSQKGNLVLLTIPSIAASERPKHQQQLHDGFKTLGCSTGTIRQNASWTRFLVHNIPTALGAKPLRRPLPPSRKPTPRSPNPGHHAGSPQTCKGKGKPTPRWLSPSHLPPMSTH
ncbi:hypothetical protein Q9L58_010490 [Maublancomyces gigas]|uniref:Uncharacterized protein n=1 Tax=Discina gigas TaxID=1032678 RepID=A0ABR3G3Y3_9PEZI